MEYFAGLDVSMEETDLCVLDREGGVVHQAKALFTPEAIATALNAAPACHRVVFETGRMAPMLYHGLQALGVPVVCIESRQAHQALKTLSTRKTDRNNARGLAHLARTGFFKPVHVKSLPAHAIRSLIIARKKLVGPRPRRRVWRLAPPRTQPSIHRGDTAPQRSPRRALGRDAVLVTARGGARRRSRHRRR
jgi:transposase